MNKGFTLTEVVGVIVILALIALLAFPPMLNLIKNSQNDIDDATKQFVYTASSQYVNKYINDFPKLESNIYCLTINDLIKENYLSSTILNDKLTLDSKVKVSISSDLKYEYIIDNECVEQK